MVHMRTKQDPMERVKVSIPRTLLRALRSALALEGKSLSRWVRGQAEAKLKESKR